MKPNEGVPNFHEVEALLQQVIQILEAEFGDTQGSGCETLNRCRQLLNRLRAVPAAASSAVG